MDRAKALVLQLGSGLKLCVQVEHDGKNLLMSLSMSGNQFISFISSFVQ